MLYPEIIPAATGGLYMVTILDDDGPVPNAFTPFTLIVTELDGMFAGKLMSIVFDVVLPTAVAPPVIVQL
jgi:hypothetical protein